MGTVLYMNKTRLMRQLAKQGAATIYVLQRGCELPLMIQTPFVVLHVGAALSLPAPVTFGEDGISMMLSFARYTNGAKDSFEYLCRVPYGNILKVSSFEPGGGGGGGRSLLSRLVGAA